jgi:hypothetical protein
MGSGLAERYGKTVELKMIEVMLLMGTKMHYCVGAEILKYKDAEEVVVVDGTTPSLPAAAEQVALVLVFVWGG